jgi:phage shock protein C
MKRLYRSRKSKVIAGVCGGIAEYFNVDPVLIRLIAVLLFFAGGAALLAYLIGIIIIPKAPPEVVIAGEAPVTLDVPSAQHTENFGPTGSLIVGVILVGLGAHFLLRRIPFFYPFYWRIWDMSWHYFWPSILILLGLLVISRAVKK